MSWLQAAVLLPFALAAPGYALSAALFPRGTLSRSERAVYSFVFGLSAAALGGLIAQTLLRLGFGVWIGLLAAITLAAGAVALRRDRGWRPRRATAGEPIHVGILGAAAMLASLAIAAGAIAVAVHGARAQQARQQFASLWAVPKGGPPATAIEVGVWNHAPAARFRLELRRSGRTIRSLRLSLPGYGRWQARLPIPPGAGRDRLLIALLEDGSPRTYRTVELDPGPPS